MIMITELFNVFEAGQRQYTGVMSLTYIYVCICLWVSVYADCVYDVGYIWVRKSNTAETTE